MARTRTAYGSVLLGLILSSTPLRAVPLRVVTSGPNPPSQYHIIDKIDWDRLVREHGSEASAMWKIVVSRFYGPYAIRTVKRVNPRHDYFIFPVCSAGMERAPLKPGQQASGAQGSVTISCR